MRFSKIKHDIKYRTGIIMVMPSVIILILISIFPLIYSLSLVFQKWNFTSGGKREFFGLGNFIILIKDARFWNSLEATIFIVFISVILELLIGLGLALLLNRKFKGDKFIRTLLVIPLVISPIVIGTVWKLLYHQSYGLLNYILNIMHLKGIPWLTDLWISKLSIIIVDTWQWAPFMFLIIYGGLQMVPVEPLEAAKVDGASGWQSFRFITMPSLIQVMFVAIFIRLIDAFKLYDIVYVLTNGGPGISTEVLGFYTYLQGFRFFNLGYAATLSYVLLIIITVIVSYLFRFIFPNQKTKKIKVKQNVNSKTK